MAERNAFGSDKIEGVLTGSGPQSPGKIVVGLSAKNGIGWLGRSWLGMAALDWMRSFGIRWKWRSDGRAEDDDVGFT
jgi:hypothetical protein